MTRILHVHFKPKHNVGDAAVVLAIREVVEKALGKVAWSSLLMRRLREEPTQRLLRFIDSHDMVIIGGGGFCSKFALPVNATLVAKMRPPIVLFGVGQNRNVGDDDLDAAQRESLGSLAHKAALCGVRDSLTQRLLASLGVSSTVTGDPALFLEPRRPWFAPPRHVPAIGFNLAAHGWGGQDALLERALELFRELIARLAATRSPQLLYMVHADGELDVAKDLRRSFPALRICRYPAPKLLHMYGRLDLAVSMMLHSSILAVAAGTPVVNVAYDEKNRAFLEDIGHPERCFPIATADVDRIHAVCESILNAGAPRAADAVRVVYGDAMSGFMARLAEIARAG